MKFQPRKCEHCGKPKGTMAFRYYRAGVAKRDYFHPDCFSTFLIALDAADKTFWENL